MAFPPRAQGPHKKDLTPLSKGGAIHKHAGKGSSMAPMPSRGTIKQLQQPATNGINNYAKASPMGAPQPSPGSSPVPDGLGSGSWAGIGQ